MMRPVHSTHLGSAHLKTKVCTHKAANIGASKQPSGKKRSAHEIEQVKFQKYEHIILVCGGIKTYLNVPDGFSVSF